MWNSNTRLVAEQFAEIKRLQEDILRWRAGRDDVNRELGGLRTQNVQLQRDNAMLAHQMELVIIQLAMANDERVALLRARGVGVADSPVFHVEHPTGAPRADQPLWSGTPLDDAAVSEAEKLATLAELERSSAVAMFDDPGDTVALALGRQHNEFGEVEHLQGR